MRSRKSELSLPACQIFRKICLIFHKFKGALRPAWNGVAKGLFQIRPGQTTPPQLGLITDYFIEYK